MPQKSYGGFGPTGYLPAVFAGMQSAYNWGRSGSGAVSGGSGLIRRRRYPYRRFGGFGSRESSALGSVVTRQRDLTLTKTKRKTPALKKALRWKRKKWLKYKRKIRRAVAPPRFRIKFYHTASRSFLTAGNSQGVCQIPICGYRGQNSANLSSPANTPLIGPVSFRQNIAATIRDVYLNNHVPAGAGNKQMVDFWWKIPKSHVDITLTNTGSSDSLDNSANSLEYEIWLVWPGKQRLQDDRNSVGPNEWIAIGRDVVQSFQSQPDPGVRLTDPRDNAWSTWMTAGAKDIVRSKLLGRGYLAVNESTRFTKSFKCKKLFTNENWIRESSNFGLVTWHLKRGVTADIMITWRGTATAPVRVGNIPRARMHFLCTWTWDTYTDGKIQSGSFDSFLFGGNDYGV